MGSISFPFSRPGKVCLRVDAKLSRGHTGFRQGLLTSASILVPLPTAFPSCHLYPREGWRVFTCGQCTLWGPAASLLSDIFISL